MANNIIRMELLRDTAIVNTDTKVTTLSDNGDVEVSRKDSDGKWSGTTIDGVTGINVTR